LAARCAARVPRTLPTMPFPAGDWCIGNTVVSKTATPGSIPGSPASSLTPIYRGFWLSGAACGIMCATTAFRMDPLESARIDPCLSLELSLERAAAGGVGCCFHMAVDHRNADPHKDRSPVGRRVEPHRIRSIEPLPNNRFKLPFFIVCAAVFVAMLAVGKSDVVAAPLLVLSIACIAVILSGRNPRWLQSPLDRWEARRRRSS
jgi:hypothetical protein